MEIDKRKIFYDKDLQIEIFNFEGNQSFPNHFHDYYVIGFLKRGKAVLSCKNKQYIISSKNIMLLNPKDNHESLNKKNQIMSYICLHIKPEILERIYKELTGKSEQPYFHENVILDEQAEINLKKLYKLIMLPEDKQEKLKKEELFLFLISNLIEKYSTSSKISIPECHNEIEKICKFMETHYEEKLSLNQLCVYSGLSKSTLLRAFVKNKGITPYKYFTALRIEKAKEFLEKGVSITDTTFLTGFSDQSHFTNFFSTLVGVTPAVYQNIFFKKVKDINKKY